ncbi:MAG: rhodanese-like domain-containing protein, partial [Hyphomicrobiaceae bacterium]|nr:rhodanese-like domain-containing protein [Hyphomicrobiaceae bacterium]
MKKFLFAVIAALMAVSPAYAAEGEKLRIIDEDTSFTVKTPDGDVVITRKMTSCAKNKGWLQPLIPAEGINPVTEIEVLKALNDKDFMVVDMREVDWFVKGTIPGAINIPYTEMSVRMDEFGC